jgi:hypothetical protein
MNGLRVNLHKSLSTGWHRDTRAPKRGKVESSPLPLFWLFDESTKPPEWKESPQFRKFINQMTTKMAECS